MARIFITGSSTGLGLLAGKRLAAKGHDVVLHARNEARAEDTRHSLSSVRHVIVGDLQTIRGAKDVAGQANELGRFDAVIHNAGIYDADAEHSEDGLPPVFAVNVLAPYLLTGLMRPAQRLVYLSSDMHFGADLDLDDLSRVRRGTKGIYAESKLLVVILAYAVARLRRGTFSNAVDPGWVPTRMGGAGATGNLEKGAATQAELAAPQPDDQLAGMSGTYLHHLKPHKADQRTRDRALQDVFLERCASLTGVEVEAADKDQDL